MRKSVIRCSAVAVLGLAAASNAAVIGTDNAGAAAYSGGWANGSNGVVTGNAFGAWALSTTTPGGFAGHFIGNSTGLAGGGVGANINTGGSAFGMYGNQDAGALSEATRSFNGALGVGQTFSADIAVNFRNGNKGIDVRDGGGVTLFNFNVGSDDHVVNVASPSGTIGNGYSSTTAFNVALAQTSAAGGTWTITRTGGVADSDTGTYTGVASSFRLYVGGTDGGDANNLFANNFSIVPEPTSLALLGVGGVAMLRRRR